MQEYEDGLYPNLELLLEEEEMIAEMAERAENLLRYLDDSVVHFVGVYEIDRQYGGPEEGGWWFDSGTLVKTYVIPPGISWEQARDIAREEWPDVSERPVSSVIYDGGCYGVYHFEGELPEPHFPTEWPHYE